ncbi:MAG: universal stress protein, partial [candidate division NC10 bacterium]|nr:universal stress protein [candidate division NC10 bacterium]
RILVPLDGSPLAETILPVAEEWAKEGEAEVLLLRSVQARPARSGGEREARVRAVEEGEAYLKGIAARIERRGLPHVRWGVSEEEPAAAIAHAARDGVDLIAMATHGRGGLSRLLLGSVAEAVIRAAGVPVLLIRGQSAWKPWATRKIVVPLDGSEASEEILPVVQRLAGPRVLTVLVVKVIDPLAVSAGEETVRRPDEFMALQREDAARYLAKVMEPLRARGLRVECHVAVGRPAETIAAVAGREQADLIVMATHGRSGLSRVLLGSVAGGVLRNASVPVLLFRTGQQTA